ncbi:hypothetical protein [Nocardia jejuensis]|uniref:hypothetical protein n=1 Tax=Nocardia jejuensis TaxID=328049 RepID=UPI000ABE6AAA|nr:hypothetical protein [Nocardia jejuensis]
MPDILEVLHARCAEIAGDAILSGEEHPNLTLTTHEVEDLLNLIADLHHRYGELDLGYHDLDDRYETLRQAAGKAALSLERIRAALEQRSAHPEATARQALTIARYAAENLADAGVIAEG